MMFFVHERRCDRGQSETLGVVLLVGVSVVAAVAVATTGYAAITSDQERVGMAQAERGLSQFDSRSSEVALGRSSGTRVDFGLPDDRGTMTAHPDAGWLRVRYTDLTAQRDPNSATVANVTLGAVVFRQDDRTVGYQGGGVFRSQGTGSVLVSRPEFHYRNGTLTVPIVQTGGDAVGAGTLQVTPNGTTRAFPDATRNLTNTVDNSTVVVTVKSRYYRAWGEFFSTYTPGIVSVDDARRTASVQFISLPDGEGVEGGIIATAESGDLALAGTGAYVDSYDSTSGPYNDTVSSAGVVKAVGDVQISADATIDANVEAGKDVRVEESSSLVTGDADYTDELVNDGTIGGSTNEIDGVPTVLPIDSLVYSRFRDTRASNDNDAANAIGGVDLTDGTLDVSSGDQVTLDSGRYYVDELRIDGGELVLDTTGGNVTLAVRNWVRIQRSGGTAGRIRVEGDGVVKLYLPSQRDTRVSFTGSGNAPTRDVNFFVGKGSAVTVPGDRAPQFRVYAPQETDVAIAGSNSNPAEFTGLVYAPDGLSLSGSAYVKQADVYGGLVSGQIILGQYGQVHYDQNLDDLLLPRASRISRLEFVHVAVHRMNVTSG